MTSNPKQAGDDEGPVYGTPPEAVPGPDDPPPPPPPPYVPPTNPDGTPKDPRDYTALEQEQWAENQETPPPSYSVPTAVALSATTVSLEAIVGDVVGTLSTATDGTGNTPETYTYTLDDNGSGAFALNGNAIEVAAALVEGDVNIVVTATGALSAQTVTTTITITVA
jgi:hypothetical protein